MATKANTKELGDNTEEANDAPLAGQGNLADAIKKLLKKGKERGHVTLDELNAILPPERISSELIEDVMAQLNDMGINVVEGEESEDDPEAQGDKVTEAEDYGRTDDPVRLYLREMGAVELLSREGEIAIAKRIEAGREMMIGGICESPLTIQAILDWNEALKAGRLLLRDIIDLDATQDSPETAAESPSVAAADTGSGDADTDAAVKSEGGDGADGEGNSDGSDSSFDDEDNISLAAIEEKLKPQVIETFDAIAATYVKLNKLQHQRLLASEKGEPSNKANDAKIGKYKEQLVELVRTVRFNNARLEQLVQQLYTLNRRLMGLEGRLLRYGLDVGLNRDEFLERYYEHELDPNWFEHILLPPPPRAVVKAAPKLVENAAERVMAHANRQRQAAEAAAAKQKIIDDKAAEKQRIAQAKKDETARVRGEAAAAKQKLKDDAAAEKAKEKERAAKAVMAAKDAATKLKAREQAARQKAAEAVAKQRARDAAAKQKEREQAVKLREREQVAKLKARAKAAEQREKERAAKERAAAIKAKTIAKKAPVKTAAKPAAKKPAPKPAAKPAAKKAPAKKLPVKAAAKKQVAKKPAPARKASVKKPAAKPARKR